MTDISFDPFDAASVQEAWPRLRELREAGAVVPLGEGMHYVTRYAEACDVLRDTGAFSSAAGFRAPGVVVPEEDRVLGEQDPPQHPFVRRVVVSAMNPAAIRAEEPFVTRCANELLEALPESGTADLVEKFTIPLPTRATVHLVGFPLSDADEIAAWSKEVMESGWPATNRTDRGEGFDGAFPEFCSYIDGHIRELRARGGEGDDVLCRLMRTEVEGKRLSDRQLRALAHNLLIGGMTTTSQLLGNLLWSILGSRDVERRLRAEPAHLPELIEESLRTSPPVMFIPRGCVEDTTIGGAPIKAGERVIVGTACANRDERVFTDGEAFSPSRDRPERHLTFGFGAHFCVGAPMARTVATKGIQALIAKYGEGDLSLAPGAVFDNVPTYFECGPRSVPVEILRDRATA